MPLLTDGYKLYLYKSISFGASIAAHPYKYNRDEGLGEMRRERFLMWRINCFLIGIYSFYLTARLVEMSRMDTKEVVDVVFLVVIMLLYWYVLFVQLLLLVKCEEVAGFLRTFPSFLATTNGPTKENAAYLKIGQKMAEFNYSGLAFNCLILIAPSVIRPTSLESLASLLRIGKTASLTPVQYAINIGLHAYLAYLCSSIYILVCPMLFLFTAPMVTAIKDLGYRKPGGMTPNQQRWIRSYNSLRVLLILFNEIYGPLMAGMKAILVTVVICGVACAIRLSGVIAIGLAMMMGDAGFALIVAFDYLASFHQESTKVLKEFRANATRTRQKCFGQSLDALQPIKFKIGSMYYADKVMVLTLIGLMMSSIMSVLLLIPPQ